MRTIQSAAKAVSHASVAVPEVAFREQWPQNFSARSFWSPLTRGR